MHSPTLAVERVSVSYGPSNLRVRAVNDVTLDFMPGTLTLLMGPSGSGKTTLLTLLGCLLRPDEGQVYINGANMNDVSERQRTEIRRSCIGFIFQAFRLFRSLSAFENVMIAADIAKARDEKHRQHALNLLRNLGLGDKLHSRPHQLSGGEKQRVAIGRALLPNPQIVLADEPTASLDSVSGRRICEILRQLADEQKHTVVVVSHDVRWTEFAHRIVILQDGCVLEDRRSCDEKDSAG